jgi:sulfoxide reductase heme-binding subunit YedZ
MVGGPPRAKAAGRPARPLGAGRDWRRRLLLHHLPLAATSGGLLALLIAVSPSHGAGFLRQSTSATGDVALVLLGLTLVIGPANLVLGRRNPVSSYLRRDVGAWTAIVSVVHVVLAFGVDGQGRILDFFIRDGRPLIDSFGLGNWTGLAALVIVAGLLALSTNAAVRELKGRTWKDLQRLNYTLFALVVLHAVFYGALLRMTSPFTLVLIFTVAAVFLAQATGIWLWRRRYPQTTAGLA